MFIQTELTPNPATIKFLPGQDISPDGSVEFKSMEETGSSPLAQRLFTMQGVDNVFFGHNFVSISKSDDTDWSMLKPMVMAVLMEHLSTGQPILIGQRSDGEPIDEDEISAQIRELIANRVRPMVMMDGGDIEFDSFDKDAGIVYLRMMGACSGCPSSTATLKMGVENMLKHFIPEVQEVRPLEG